MMASDNLIDDLQAFGFSALEAKVYLALIEQNALYPAIKSLKFPVSPAPMCIRR